MPHKLSLDRGRTEMTLSDDEAVVLRALDGLRRKHLLLDEETLRGYGDDIEVRFPGCLTPLGEAAVDKLAEAQHTHDDPVTQLRDALKPFADLADTELDPNSADDSPGWRAKGESRLREKIDPADLAAARKIYDVTRPED